MMMVMMLMNFREIERRLFIYLHDLPSASPSAVGN